MKTIKRNFRVLVTPQDVELATRDVNNPERQKSVCSLCVMARAIARHMKISQDCVRVTSSYTVGGKNLSIQRKNRGIKYYKLSRKGQRIVRNFDNELPIETGVYVHLTRVVRI